MIKKRLEKLSKESKIKICKKLDLTEKDFDKYLKLEKIPIGLAYLIMKETGKIDYKWLLENTFWDLTKNLTFDDDRWGARRKHDKLLGLFKRDDLEDFILLELEKALKSTLILSIEEKIHFIKSQSKLSKSQLMDFLDLVEKEMIDIEKRLFYERVCNDIDNGDLKKRILENKREWKKFENNLESKFYRKKDFEGDLYPYFLFKELKKYVIGQDEALKIISTFIYYQKKIAKAIYKGQKIPFNNLKPLLISGETGSGKSYMIKKACEIMDIPFLHVDASSMVSTGIVGMSVGSIGKFLLRKNDYNLDKVKGAVVILDEFDKLLENSVYGNTILAQLLRMIEGGGIYLDLSKEEALEFGKINFIPTENMFFVFVGSFHFLRDKSNISGFLNRGENYKEEYIKDIENSGLPKELLGRVGEVVILNSLTKEDLRKILLKSKDSPLDKYIKMLKLNGINLKLKYEDIENIVEKAASLPYGARSLEKIVWDYFKDKLFDVHKGIENVSSFEILLNRFEMI